MLNADSSNYSCLNFGIKKVLIKKTLFAWYLSDNIVSDNTITLEKAELLFAFFKNCPLFRWSDANNDCEDRANAICILLDEWKIQNCKGWVFSGYVFKKIGYLKNLWKYHVAAAVLVRQGNEMNTYIIDPATSASLLSIEDWAANVTDYPHSYYLVKSGRIYIFPSRKMKKDNWYHRNKRNYNWTIQGLSGINGVSTKGKAQLRFNKRRMVKTKEMFMELLKNKPAFLNDDAD